MEYILIAITGFLYLIFNELEDKSIKSNWRIYTSFLNTEDSWKRKYKTKYDPNTDEKVVMPYEEKWYHFGVNPKYKEWFPFSSTLFVFITDGEHLFQFLKHMFVIIGFWVISWLFALSWLIGKIIASLTKEKIKKID